MSYVAQYTFETNCRKPSCIWDETICLYDGLSQAHRESICLYYSLSQKCLDPSFVRVNFNGILRPSFWWTWRSLELETACCFPKWHNASATCVKYVALRTRLWSSTRHPVPKKSPARIHRRTNWTSQTCCGSTKWQLRAGLCRFLKCREQRFWDMIGQY